MSNFNERKVRKEIKNFFSGWEGEGSKREGNNIRVKYTSNKPGRVSLLVVKPSDVN